MVARWALACSLQQFSWCRASPLLPVSLTPNWGPAVKGRGKMMVGGWQWQLQQYGGSLNSYSGSNSLCAFYGWAAELPSRISQLWPEEPVGEILGATTAATTIVGSGEPARDNSPHQSSWKRLSCQQSTKVPDPFLKIWMSSFPRRYAQQF